MDPVPEHAVLNDKIFEENIAFGGFQGTDQGFKKSLPGRIIGSFGITVRRTEGSSADISGLTCGIRIVFGEGADHIVTGIGGRFGDRGDGVHFFPAGFGDMVPAEDDIHRAAEQREQQNDDNPRELVGHIPAGVNDPQDKAQFQH